jgi:hypothetical protein
MFRCLPGAGVAFVVVAVFHRPMLTDRVGGALGLVPREAGEEEADMAFGRLGRVFLLRPVAPDVPLWTRRSDRPVFSSAYSHLFSGDGLAIPFSHDPSAFFNRQPNALKSSRAGEFLAWKKFYSV